MKELSRELIFEKMKSLVEKIRQLEIVILSNQYTYAKLKDPADNIKLTVATEIAGEKDTNGKMIYSNSTKREAELNKRLKSDSAYLDIASDLEKIEERIHIDSIELGYNKRLFRAFESVTRVGE